MIPENYITIFGVPCKLEESKKRFVGAAQTTCEKIQALDVGRKGNKLQKLREENNSNAIGLSLADHRRIF